MANRQALVKAYINALDARALLIYAGAGGGAGTISLSENNNLELFDTLWFAKAAHAELVLMNCPQSSTLPPASLRDEVINIAATLGASWRTTTELEADASNAVAEIIECVEAMRQSGGLAQVNAQYKIYRQAQVAKGQKAIPYSEHLFAFTMSLVILAARNA
jgi:hypothetical protein